MAERASRVLPIGLSAIGKNSNNVKQQGDSLEFIGNSHELQ